MSGVTKLGVIGGSSFLKSAYFSAFEPITVETEWGVIRLRQNKEGNVFFVQRHMAHPDHEYSPPHLINKRGIIQALKNLGVTHVLAFGSVGSLRRSIPVGSMLVPDDYLLLAEQISFFETVHTSAGHLVPSFSGEMRKRIIRKLNSVGIYPLESGTYVQTRGPRFETASEVRFYAEHGHIVGMTAAHEAVLCNEAGLSFALVCMVDNMANGVQSHTLSTDDFHAGVAQNLKTNEQVLGALLAEFAPLSALPGLFAAKEEAEAKAKAAAAEHKGDGESKEHSYELPERKLIDLMVFSRYIVPVEPHPKVVHEGYVLCVDNGIIVDLVTAEIATKRYRAKRTEIYNDHVVLPGFVNGHTHIGMTMLRGFSDDLCLADWLSKEIWPAEGKFCSPEFVKIGSQLACAELIRSGCTTINDMYFFPEDTAAVIDQVGMRALLGMTILEFPTAYAKDADDYFNKGMQFYQKYKDHPRIRASVAPHAPYTVSDATFERVSNISKTHSLPIHVHLHETKAEVHDSATGHHSMSKHLSNHLCRPLANFDRLGLLSEKMIAVHMTQLNEEEIAVCKQRKINIVQCPSSNLKLASGFTPIAALRKDKVNVCLGTDSSASNNSLDMFAEAKTAAILAKAVSQDPEAMPSHDILRCVTINGARALGLGDVCGSLKPGKQADFIVIRFDQLDLMPVYDVISHLVYCCSKDKVCDVFVAGKQLMKNRELLTIDETALIKSVRGWNHELAEFKISLEKTNKKHRRKSSLDEIEHGML